MEQWLKNKEGLGTQPHSQALPSPWQAWGWGYWEHSSITHHLQCSITDRVSRHLYGWNCCKKPTFKLISAPVPYETTRPHLRERVWWHPADTSGFINVDYFLERSFSPPITLQKRQSVVQHRKFLASSARWHSTFLARKLVIGSQLCIQQAMNF